MRSESLGDFGRKEGTWGINEKVYIWGLYGNPENMLNKNPEEINFKFEICMMDCGDLLTIFLAKDGTVYTYGENIGNSSGIIKKRRAIRNWIFKRK